jgi:hypothetical protein
MRWSDLVEGERRLMCLILYISVVGSMAGVRREELDVGAGDGDWVAGASSGEVNRSGMAGWGCT